MTGHGDGPVRPGSFALRGPWRGRRSCAGGHGICRCLPLLAGLQRDCIRSSANRSASVNCGFARDAPWTARSSAPSAGPSLPRRILLPLALHSACAAERVCSAVRRRSIAGRDSSAPRRRPAELRFPPADGQSQQRQGSFEGFHVWVAAAAVLLWAGAVAPSASTFASRAQLSDAETPSSTLWRRNRFKGSCRRMAWSMAVLLPCG